MNDQYLLIVLIVIMVFLFLFIVLREVMCWYWKINKIIDLLTNISEKMKDTKTEKLTSEDYF